MIIFIFELARSGAPDLAARAAKSIQERAQFQGGQSLSRIFRKTGKLAASAFAPANRPQTLIRCALPMNSSWAASSAATNSRFPHFRHPIDRPYRTSMESGVEPGQQLGWLSPSSRGAHRPFPLAHRKNHHARSAVSPCDSAIRHFERRMPRQWSSSSLQTSPNSTSTAAPRPSLPKGRKRDGCARSRRSTDDTASTKGVPVVPRPLQSPDRSVG